MEVEQPVLLDARLLIPCINYDKSEQGEEGESIEFTIPSETPEISSNYNTFQGYCITEKYDPRDDSIVLYNSGDKVPIQTGTTLTLYPAFSLKVTGGGSAGDVGSGTLENPNGKG